MATVKPNISHNPSPGDVRGWGISWPAMVNTDVGGGISMIDYADRTIQVEGVFGTGGNLRLEGTNDGTNWRVLHDPLGVALDITAPGIVQIAETVAQMRPHVTAGDGNTLLTATLFSRRTQ